MCAWPAAALTEQAMTWDDLKCVAVLHLSFNRYKVEGETELEMRRYFE